jgi:uncharacterized protein YbjT (DUF2867 family)
VAGLERHAAADVTIGASPLVLVAGATGYVGGRLVRALRERGVRVRCLARRPDYLVPRVAAGAEVVAGDCLDRTSLDAPLRGVDVAYYLIHSMAAVGDFAERDRAAARNFADAAAGAGVRRIVYLGGLGDTACTASALSEHLRSRQETGTILASTGVPTVEFRASVILGSGSLSFERALVERLPVMICPRWVGTETQPIAIEDVVAYLAAALDLPQGPSRVFEIGGADRVSYGAIMREYARQRGLRRLLISIPILTPRLSSLWLGLVTPIYARVGRHLIEGVRNPTVVTDDTALRVFGVRPIGVAQAIQRALVLEDQAFAETRWSDALSSVRGDGPYGGHRSGPRFVYSLARTVAAPADAAFAPIRRIGGRRGWYSLTWLWDLRGLVDLALGGAGVRRGRRDPDHLRVGDTVDFWRVESYEEGRRLRLRAEMRLPGRAWLEFEVMPRDDASILRQTAVFEPTGAAGLLYWFVLYPVHVVVFRRMLTALAQRVAGRRDLSHIT